MVADPSDRVLLHRRGSPDGPTVILVGGLHGNEPAGVRALERLAAGLGNGTPVRGEVLAVAGNTTALADGVRYHDVDMNRGWWPDALASESVHGSEDRERQELMDLLDPVIDGAASAPIVLDFHTTSGDTPPFVTLGDTLRNRRFAEGFPLPVILGLEELLAATFLEYVNNRGCITLGCEGGRHDDPRAVDYLEAVAWVALVRAGALRRDAVPGDPWRLLREAAGGRPRVFEVRHREAVPATRRLRMRPGYRSFQPITRGEILGEWEDGQPIEAPETGRILMPLYQAQGDDGYFLIREVRRFWLRVSAILRRARADRLGPLLPGVRRHPYIADAVIVDRRVARWFTVEIFHLLGFRRKVDQGDELIMARRHFDRPSHWP